MSHVSPQAFYLAMHATIRKSRVPNSKLKLGAFRSLARCMSRLKIARPIAMAPYVSPKPPMMASGGAPLWNLTSRRPVRIEATTRKDCEKIDWDDFKVETCAVMSDSPAAKFCNVNAQARRAIAQ